MPAEQCGPECLNQHQPAWAFDVFRHMKAFKMLPEVAVNQDDLVKTREDVSVDIDPLINIVQVVERSRLRASQAVMNHIVVSVTHQLHNADFCSCAFRRDLVAEAQAKIIGSGRR